MLEMMTQGLKDVLREDLGFQIGEEQLRERLLPFLAMRLQSVALEIRVNNVMRQLVYKGDQHLIGVKVAIQCNAAHPVIATRGTEIA